MTPETTVKTKIRNYLQDEGWYIRSIPSTQYSRAGNPDYYAIKDSKVIFIEVKSITGKLTAAQIKTKEEIETHSGTYIVARCVEDIIINLQNNETNIQ